MNSYDKPAVNDCILINNKHIGIIHKIIWNSNGYIVKLESNDNYEDKTLKQYNLLGETKNIQGYMLVTPNDKIIKIDSNNIQSLIELSSSNNMTSILNKINLKYKNYTKELNSNSNSNLNMVNLEESDKKKEIEYDNIFKPDKFEIYRKQAVQEDNYIKYIEKIISDLFISDTNFRWEENFYIGSGSGSGYGSIDDIKSINVLGEQNIDEIKQVLVTVLEKFNQIEPEHIYEFDNTLMYKHLIYNENIDTISLGKELIGLIKDTLIDIQKSIQFDDGEKLLSYTNLFDFLNFKIIGGYIEIININSTTDIRIITPELVHDLNELSFQYYNPIDYNILLPIVLENKTPQNVMINKSMIEEALKILSQEYILCFQPNCDILLWTIARIILCWYADPKLNSNIYKIKILINLFRSRGDKEFNKDHGVLPMIQIIPNYGKKNAIQVLSHLSYFFFPYKKLGSLNSNPTWFDSIDNLMYYTNGSLELKKYIKYLINTGSKFSNPMTADLTQINIPFIENKIEYTIKKN
jgi:hypothetical protein